jgi:transposase InsO family protein
MLWCSRILNGVARREIEYLREENRALRKALGRRRLVLTDARRRRLAAKAKVLGRGALQRLATIVSPDTLLRWHRELVAAKWTQPARRRPGRPRKPQDICELVLRLARENPGWGLTSIQGRLENLGHSICPTTIRRILNEHGIPPAGERMTTWRQFVRQQSAVLAATDFFTTEVWTMAGLQTLYVLFGIDLQTRAVEILGTTSNPDEGFMAQVARNITGVACGWWARKTMLIMDRDTKFSMAFRAALARSGIQSIVTPARAPNANAHAERFVRSIKDECLRRVVLVGEDSLRRALREYAAYYNRERNHQGIGNELIDPRPGDLDGRGPVERRSRLGGLLNFYRRKAT